MLKQILFELKDSKAITTLVLPSLSSNRCKKLQNNELFPLKTC
jgi:hypothetical protein